MRKEETMSKTHWTERVPRSACAVALESAREYPTFQAWWDDCERADWMLWGIGMMSPGEVGSPTRKRLVACALDCAKTAWKWMPEEGRECCRTVEKYLNGKATLDDVQQDVTAADAAANAATAYANAATAYAAAATTAAATTAAVTTAAADSAADSASLKRMAKMIRRKHYPKPPRLPRNRQKESK